MIYDSALRTKYSVQYMREFTLSSSSPTLNGGKSAKGEAEEENKDPFIPHVIYDALKEKTRFDAMRVSDHAGFSSI